MGELYKIRGWNRKEGRRNIDFENGGGQARSSCGCIKKGEGCKPLTNYDVVITCDLSNMMQWILLGPNQNLISESPVNSFENSVSLGTQFMIQSFKTKR